MDPEELKRQSRGISADMSPAAINRRLDMLGQLHEVWELLRSARRIGPAIRSDAVAEDPPRHRPDERR